MRYIPIQPSPDSELGRRLVELESAQAEAYAAQQDAARLRDEYTEAERALRHALYAGPASQRTPIQLDELRARVAELEEQRTHQEKLMRPILARVRALGDEFDHQYGAWLQLVAANDRQRRLGG